MRWRLAAPVRRLTTWAALSLAGAGCISDPMPALTVRDASIDPVVTSPHAITQVRVYLVASAVCGAGASRGPVNEELVAEVRAGGGRPAREVRLAEPPAGWSIVTAWRRPTGDDNTQFLYVIAAFAGSDGEGRLCVARP